jgi:6-phosphogluconolactonase
MPKFARAILIVGNLCVLGLIPGCGSNKQTVCNPPSSSASASSPCGCACPANFYDYLYAVGNGGEVTTVPVHQLIATLGTPTTSTGPAVSVGLVAVNLLQLNSAFLYASDPQAQGGGAIDAWATSRATGILSTVAGSPFNLGASAQPNGLAVATLGSPGPFLYVADTGQIDALQVNTSTGALTAVAGSPFTSGTNTYLTVDPMNRFVFAADTNSAGAVYAFTIDASTGALTAVPGSPFLLGSGSSPAQPSQIAVDSSGNFVYVTLPSAGQVAGFSIDGSSGVLTAIPGSPFAAGAGASAIAATTGEALYVANPTANSISGFSINATTGALVPVAGSPLTVAGVTALTTDGYGDLYASGENGLEVVEIGGIGILMAESPVASSAATALAVVGP